VRRILLAGIVAVLIAAVALGCGSSGGDSTAGASSAGASTGSAPRAGESRAGRAEKTSAKKNSRQGTTNRTVAVPMSFTEESPPASATPREEVTLAVPSSLAGGELSEPHRLEVPKGWTASVWARPEAARMMAVTPEGQLLVSEPSLGSVLMLGGEAVAESEKVILAGLESPQGLAFGPGKGGGGKVLYVGESDQIDAYAWLGGGKLGPQRVIAPNLPDEEPSGDDIHRQKDVVVGSDGRIYFDVGSSDNAKPIDRTYVPPRGTISSVGPEGGPVKTVMTGVRNGEGLALAPDGTVWTAINNRDEILYPLHREAEGHEDAFGELVREYVDDHPTDEVVPVSEGRDLGWPLCDPEQGESTPRGSFANVPLIPDAENNPTGSKLDCGSLEPIQVGIPAHSAPLGISFLAGTKTPAPWSGGAVLAAHGSWDRQEPRPPAVLWLRWDAKAHTLFPAETLVSGFQDEDGERWGRPVDVVPGPGGELFVSDDTAGAIYKLTPPR
jgi:glucose/arabinose dehydrogenase